MEKLVEPTFDVGTRARRANGSNATTGNTNRLAQEIELAVRRVKKVDLTPPTLEVALAVAAEALVTGNVRHFPPSRRDGIRVLSPRAFVEEYRGR